MQGSWSVPSSCNLSRHFNAPSRISLRIVSIRVGTDGRNHRRRPGVLDEASRQSADTGASGPELILYLVQCLCHVRCPVRSCANILRVADLEALRIPYMLRPHCSRGHRDHHEYAPFRLMISSQIAFVQTGFAIVAAVYLSMVWGRLTARCCS